jgi:hypothetical protein
MLVGETRGLEHRWRLLRYNLLAEKVPPVARAGLSWLERYKHGRSIVGRVVGRRERLLVLEGCGVSIEYWLRWNKKDEDMSVLFVPRLDEFEINFKQSCASSLAGWCV